MNRGEAESFIGKWLQAEPWQRLPLLFEPAAQRPLREVLEAIGFELRQAALASSDERVATVKLGWWAEEWQCLAQGQPRHPLTRALAPVPALDVASGQRWVASAGALAADDSAADLDALLSRWAAYAAAEQALQAHWLLLPASLPDVRSRGLSLLADRLHAARQELARGRMPLPLSVLAEHGLTRPTMTADDAAASRALAAHACGIADALALLPDPPDRYRRIQLQLSMLRARSVASDGTAAWAGQAVLPRWRSALVAWRASRSA
jgi:phytoene synthase